MSQIIPDHTNTHITTLNEPHYTRLQRHTHIVTLNESLYFKLHKHTYYSIQ